MRTALYIRQSDTGGHGADSLSIESQEAELRARCDREGWAVVLMEVEPDIRGWTDEQARPAFSRILDAASRGDIELVLVWDLSRLARNVEFQERWVRVLGRMGVEVESHTQPEVRTSPLLRQIHAAINEERTREIRAHVRRSMRQRAENGLTHGRPPFGYRRAPRSPLEPDPDTAPVVREMYRLRYSGASVEEIRTYLEDAGVPTLQGAPAWRWGVVDVILKNPVYKGTVVSGQVVRPHAHEPLVDEVTWQAAQERATRYRSRTGAASQSWLSGLVDHACGRRMHVIRPNLSHPVPYFRCSRASSALAGPRDCRVRPTSMSSTKVEAAAWDAALDVLDRLMPAAEVLADAKRRYRESAPEAQREHRAAEAAADRARQRLARAEGLYLEAKRDRAWFDQEDAKARAALAAAEARLAALPLPPDRAHIEAQLAALRSLRQAAAGLRDADRARLVAALGRVVVGDGPVRLELDPDIASLVRPE